MTRIVLVHGWGYDSRIWDDVRSRLDPGLDVATLDLGFFGGTTRMPAIDEPVIAVGHSLGALWWLSQSAIPWQRLLCLNGFPRFTESDAYAPAIAPRVLARMRAQFARDPGTVLADFHSRCAGHAPAASPAVEQLAAGLDWLAEWDGRTTLAARRDDIFALAGSADPIVPPAMSAMAFADLPPGHLEYVDVPGHLLPQSQPDLCAHRIARLAA